MSNINKDFSWLQANPSRRFEVYDVATEQSIYKGISAKDILQEHQSFEAFIEHLKTQGYEKIAIQKARKHGNAQVRIGLLNKYALTEKQNVKSQLVGGGAQAQASPSTTNETKGLMGEMGLSMPALMKMNADAEKYSEEKSKVERLEKKVEKLEDENKKLDREVLRYELGVEAKPGAIERLLETVSNNPQLIETAIQALSQAKTPAAALNAPAATATESVSKIKAALIQVVQQGHISDEAALAAYHVLNQAGNPSFMNAFKELLKKHQD